MIKVNEANKTLEPSNCLWRGQARDFSGFISIASGEVREPRNSVETFQNFASLIWHIVCDNSNTLGLILQSAQVGSCPPKKNNALVQEYYYKGI